MLFEEKKGINGTTTAPQEKWVWFQKCFRYHATLAICKGESGRKGCTYWDGSGLIQSRNESVLLPETLLTLNTMLIIASRERKGKEKTSFPVAKPRCTLSSRKNIAGSSSACYTTVRHRPDDVSEKERETTKEIELSRTMKVEWSASCIDR